jgi:hypothetical protein
MRRRKSRIIATTLKCRKNAIVAGQGADLLGQSAAECPGVQSVAQSLGGTLVALKQRSGKEFGVRPRQPDLQQGAAGVSMHRGRPKRAGCAGQADGQTLGGRFVTRGGGLLNGGKRCRIRHFRNRAVQERFGLNREVVENIGTDRDNSGSWNGSAIGAICGEWA